MIALGTGAVVLLVLLAALTTAGETAVFSVTSTRLRTLLEEGFDGATALTRIRDQPSTFRDAVHVLATALNFAALGLVVLEGARRGGVRGAGIWLAIALPVLLFLTEILPRAIAHRRPVRMALVSAPVFVAVLRRFGFVLAPFMRLEDALAGRDRDGDEDDEEREVREIATLGREAGIVELEEHVLVERAFRLDELTAWDVMTPRVDIFGWKDSLALSEIINELEAVPYSRVPVYGDSIDDITGILYVREALETWVSGRKEVKLRELARAPFFLPGSMSLALLMRDFQGRRIHMGIVADEFGGTDGLVTLEDALEELVGEIVDETDLEEEGLQQVTQDEWVAEAGIDVRMISEAVSLDLPPSEHRSLNGFILEELGYVPEAGEIMERGGVVIEVLEASETQVLRARIRRSETPTEEEES